MNDSDQFTETQEYQIKLLAFMLSSPDFCAVAGNALQQEAFSDKALQWYFDTLSNSTQTHTSVTLKEDLFKAVKAKQIKEHDVDKYVEYYGHICQRPVPIEQQHIKENLGEFIKTQKVKHAIIESWDLVRAGNFEDLVPKMSEAVKTDLDVMDMGYFYFESTKDRLSTRLTAPILEKLTTGIPDLDSVLYGGIRPKQLGLIAGGTGRGKSIMLEWLARVAVLLDKKVVYYTLELSEEDVADRFDALFAQIKINELKTYNNDVFKSLNNLSGKFGQNLVIKEYPADTATVDTLKHHLLQLSSIGWQPDLVIVDYLDLLKPHRSYNAVHEELDAITKALHGFSKELETRVWTATQLNRSGLTMETPDESTIAGAVAKLFTPDVAIFLAATPEEREDQEMRLLIAKNRNGPAPRTVKIDTDYSRMTFYRPPAQVTVSTPTTGSATTEEEENGQGVTEENQVIRDVDDSDDGDVFIL